MSRSLSPHTSGTEGSKSEVQRVDRPPTENIKLTAEFDSVTNRDYFLDNTTVSVTMTFVTATELTTGSYNTLQITLPAVKLDGDTPKAVSDGVVTQDLGFTVLDNAVDAPVYIVLRNLDTVA